jgi:hypothetical protein
MNAATKRFDPRKLMELAVEVMVKSTQEPRGDDKASPLAGAVLWNDGAVDTASRTARNHLKHLTEVGLLRMTGAARATSYEVVR